MEEGENPLPRGTIAFDSIWAATEDNTIMKLSHKAKWILSMLAVVSTGRSETPPKAASLLSLPLSFEANQGQTDAAVKFFSRGDGYALFLTPDSAVFKLRA